VTQCTFGESKAECGRSKRISCGAGEQWASRKYQGEQIMSNLGQSGFVRGTTGKQRFFEELRRGAKGLVVGLALAATASGAWAGTGDKSISVSVTPLPDAVSYSVTSLTQNTYAAYKVTVKSIAKSGASNIWLKGDATTATFKQSTNNVCVDDGGDHTAVTCELGAFAFNESKEFVVVFNVPNAPVPPATGQSCTLRPNLGSECIAFDWRIANGQGTANSQPSESQFSQGQRVETKVSVADTTGDSSSVQSYILVNGLPPPEGGTTDTGFLSTNWLTARQDDRQGAEGAARCSSSRRKLSATMDSCQNIYACASRRNCSSKRAV
jgi:hypothetical protein